MDVDKDLQVLAEPSFQGIVQDLPAHLLVYKAADQVFSQDRLKRWHSPSREDVARLRKRLEDSHHYVRLPP